VQSQPFSLNELVLESVQANDRLVGGCGCRPAAEQEMTLKSLEHAGESGSWR
jgi:hypothetical protein